MNRNTLTDISGRAMHQAVRMTLNKANDDPMMQELDFDGMNSDGRNKVERVQGFGFTSMPLPRDEDKKGGGQQGGGGDGANGMEKEKGPAAEGIALFLGGQRNHPVVIAVDDRRHRPMGLKAGENAQYDDQGQMTLLRRNGLFLLSLDDEEGSGNGGASTRAADGSQQENKERMVSLRHVKKKKQERKGQGQGQGGSGAGGASAGTFAEGGGASGGGQKKEHKHEGEEINTEVRLTKKRIEFRVGDAVVGFYDTEAKRWCFIGEVKLGSDDADHPVYGVNGGVGKTTKTSGAGAVLVKAPQPGPPTSLDAQP